MSKLSKAEAHSITLDFLSEPFFWTLTVPLDMALIQSLISRCPYLLQLSANIPCCSRGRGAPELVTWVVFIHPHTSGGMQPAQNTACTNMLLPAVQLSKQWNLRASITGVLLCEDLRKLT